MKHIEHIEHIEQAKHSERRKMPIILSAMLAAAILFAAGPALASSLWVNNSSLFTDRKASAVGDIVMVKVSEEIDDSDEGKITSNKSTNEDVKGGFGILDFIRAFGFGSASSMSSNTKVERTKELDMTLSCLVTDVMPNGNLVIMGDRYLTSGAEKMKVTFSGVVRPMDISHKNVVESTRVANAEITVAGKGMLSRTQRPGLISQIMKAIF